MRSLHSLVSSAKFHQYNGECHFIPGQVPHDFNTWGVLNESFAFIPQETSLLFQLSKLKKRTDPNFFSTLIKSFIIII